MYIDDNALSFAISYNPTFNRADCVLKSSATTGVHDWFFVEAERPDVKLHCEMFTLELWGDHNFQHYVCGFVVKRFALLDSIVGLPKVAERLA